MAVKLSVVVPVYGTEPYLRKCLDSLAQQTLSDAEFLIVNDATPDQSMRIAGEFAARDARFRIISHEVNKGLFAARVTGASHAMGEYIAFLDSDDYVSVDFYRAAVSLADDGGFDIVMGDTVWVQENGDCVVRPLHRDLLPDEPLYGDDVRKAFFAQEMSCYSWHTIWNKVYRKSLFDQCLPVFASLDAHVIMTEDIAFSSVLMHRARSLARLKDDGVFYCMHAASSTNAAYADKKRFFKHYGDIVTVFDFVGRYLAAENDEASLAHLANARRWYCRMWADARRQCASRGQDKARADALTHQLCPGFNDDEADDQREIWWFDQMTVPWNDGLERIKRAIAGLDGEAPEVVSFDVFDTLIQRPFRYPGDLFCMLEDTWQKVNRRCLISFAAVRGEAESAARHLHQGYQEDVALTDIYDVLQQDYGVSEDCAEQMRRAECHAEIDFCQPRHTGIALYRMAKALNRKAVLISDMYLDRDTITAMLHRWGVKDWDDFFLSNEQNALKWNGKLYRCALETLAIQPRRMLHIGDNWSNDYIKPAELGIRAMHHPRAMDVMTDTNRTQLGQLGNQTAASFGSESSLQAALSYRCMQALAANRFFDNGFSATTSGSCFASSPALMGYYAVGGHVLSVAQWLIESARRDGVKRLVFLARDGWLVKQAVDLLLKSGGGMETVYCPASRRCLMPALTVNKTDFYALPVNAPAYTAGKMLALLSFCTADVAQSELQSMVEAAGFKWDEPFGGNHRYAEFVRWYLANLYDGGKHQKAYNLLREYYENILTEGCACFDMGYSGRLQSALNQLARRSVPVYYIHSDDHECPRLASAYDFRTTCFYGMKPGMSGAFREFLLSSAEAPCTGFTRDGAQVVPVYGQSEYSMAARCFIDMVQKNALRFVREYHAAFAGTPAQQVNPMVCSMPFESALRYLGGEDLSMLQGLAFEDEVFAGRSDLDLSDLIRDQSAAVNTHLPMGRQALVGFVPSQTPLVKRTIGFMLFDRSLLKEKAKRRLGKHPAAYRLCRTGWRGLKRIKKIFRKEAH